jgi:ATP-dependent helicase IRC3
VVFAVDIAHLESLTETFRQYGYDARALSSKTSDDERAQMLKDFRDQKFPVIVNCGILTEGTGKITCCRCIQRFSHHVG